MNGNSQLTKMCELIILASQKNMLKKAVFSKCSDKSLVRAVATPKIISGNAAIQIEYFHTDNKATHKNLFISQISLSEIYEISEIFSQINLICSGCDAEYKCSSKGRTTIINDKRVENILLASDTAEFESQGNNRIKKHILTGNEPFLKLLDVSDNSGRIYDKKQSKFKQINRFLEIIRDCEDKLPKDEIFICDLCCGKSYLSFAAYHYFSVIKGMKVTMVGVDLKSDVIEHCQTIADELGFSNLKFICADINSYTPPFTPSLVISLHACDVATDIVLLNAVQWKTSVILSTPCCHHELNNNIDCKELEFITKHSMLRQKLCDAATDALRLARLEASGYSTSTVELIDPNETPKNIMLKAFLNRHFDKDSKEARKAQERYERAKEFICGSNLTKELHF